MEGRDPERLAESRLEALRWAVGASADLVFVADTAGRVIFVNLAASARWSAGGDARAGFPEEAREAFAAAQASALGGGPSRFEWGEQGAGGVSGWFVCSVSPLREHDAVVGTLCASAGVTELKRSVERLRRSEQLMVDTHGVAHLGTWDWDVREPHATWSDELYRIYGLTPETYTPSYEAYLTKVHPEDRQRVIDATNRVFHEHVPYSHDERIFRPDGSIRFLHTWAYPVLDAEGKLQRLIGVCQDITERKLAEAQVQRLNASLEARVAERTRTIETSMRDLEAFNYTLSHDLRAPLSVIQLSGELIRRHLAAPVPAPISTSLKRIERSVVDMSALVDKLLALARVGHTQLQRVEVDLSGMSLEVCADLARRSPDRRVDVQVAPDLRVVADRRLMRAVMQNLLENAWKYSSRVESARIEVARAAEEGRAPFFVRDNGAGFAMTDAHRLFAPFERLHKDAEFAGTGVGLATVHRIVERHGGRVWAESEPGRGATFFFELPDG